MSLQLVVQLLFLLFRGAHSHCQLYKGICGMRCFVYELLRNQQSVGYSKTWTVNLNSFIELYYNYLPYMSFNIFFVQVCDVSGLHYLELLFPNCQSVVHMPDTGHSVNLVQPGSLANQLCSFHGMGREQSEKPKIMDQ